MVEAAESSQLSLWCYNTIRRHISKSTGFCIHCCKTLVSYSYLHCFDYFSFHFIVHWNYFIIIVILCPILSFTEYVAVFSGYIYKTEDT
jgi:hypothetical protein